MSALALCLIGPTSSRDLSSGPDARSLAIVCGTIVPPPVACDPLSARRLRLGHRCGLNATPLHGSTVDRDLVHVEAAGSCSELGVPKYGHHHCSRASNALNPPTKALWQVWLPASIVPVLQYVNIRRTRSAELPVRVQALAVAAGAVTVAALGHVPMVITVGSAAVLAESCIVVEPGDMDLGEGERRPERLRDPLCSACLYGVAVAVVDSNALEDEVSLSRLAIQQEGALYGAGPLLPLGGEFSRRHQRPEICQFRLCSARA